MLTPEQTAEMLSLQALADGETVKEFAYRTGRHCTSAQSIVHRARKTLGARTNTQAVVAAVRKDLIA